MQPWQRRRKASNCISKAEGRKQQTHETPESQIHSTCEGTREGTCQGSLTLYPRVTMEFCREAVWMSSRCPKRVKKLWSVMLIVTCGR